MPLGQIPFAGPGIKQEAVVTRIARPDGDADAVIMREKHEPRQRAEIDGGQLATQMQLDVSRVAPIGFPQCVLLKVVQAVPRFEQRRDAQARWARRPFAYVGQILSHLAGVSAHGAFGSFR